MTVPMIYRSVEDKGAALLRDAETYFRICRAQRDAEVRGLPIPPDSEAVLITDEVLAQRAADRQQARRSQGRLRRWLGRSPA